MNILARFQAINDNDKSAVVRKLMQSSTPDFDYFYFVGLSVSMAALGLLIDSTAIVIGSMLIAPLMYPILGLALGLVMSNAQVIGRSFVTLTKSMVIGLVVAILATFLFQGDTYLTNEVLLRTSFELHHFVVAMIAGLAVSYALAQPEWSETLPGIAISVALIPPLATMGIGLAVLNSDVFIGAFMLLLINMGGILFAAMVSFSLMNLYQKQNIAASTIKREDERIEEEAKAIQEVLDNKGEKAQN